MPTCLITAVNRGIGLELARAAIDRGWTVLGSVRSEKAAEEASRALGQDCRLLQFDVTDHAAIRQAASEVACGVDLLINNAGIIGPERQSPSDMDFDGFADTLAINTLTPLAISQQFLPHLRRSASGKILTISSQMSWMGYRKPDKLAYRASKAAVNKVMQGLATALEAEGIPVALIDPGWVRTDMGGPEADNASDVVANGILSVAEKLTIEFTGRFFKWSGEERPF